MHAQPGMVSGPCLNPLQLPVPRPQFDERTNRAVAYDMDFRRFNEFIVSTRAPRFLKRGVLFFPAACSEEEP
jgi:hypothetical protein